MACLVERLDLIVEPAGPGLGNDPPAERIERAVARRVPRPVALAEMEPGLGVTVVPYSPLGRGMLTGQAFAENLSASDARSYFPRFSAENREANMRLVTKIEEIAAGQGVTSAQVAVAWLYAKAREMGATVSPIPGTRNRSRLQQNVAAASMTLEPAAMAELEPLARSVAGIAI